MGERRPGRGSSEAHHRQPPPSQSAVVVAPAAEPTAKGGGSLIEFSSIARDDPNEGLVFGETPEHCTCPHCERTVVTFIDHEASWVTWLLGFMVWFSLGWMMAFVILPLLWPAFKDVVHHCPRCLNVIARKSRISFPTFRTEVMTFKIGGCAVVLARKYVAILVGLALTIIVVYLLRSTVHLNQVAEVQKGPPSMLTWDDFLFECGPRTSLRHRTSTVRAFEDRFRRRTFQWQGEVRMIREGFEVLFLRTKSVVLIKMYPQRYPRRGGDVPDVALLFGEERNLEVATLNPGDWVEFEATMTAHGYRGDPEVMTLWHIKEAARPEPLSSSPGKSAHSKEEEDRPKAATGALWNASRPAGSNRSVGPPDDLQEPVVAAWSRANTSGESAKAGAGVDAAGASTEVGAPSNTSGTSARANTWGESAKAGAGVNASGASTEVGAHTTTSGTSASNLSSRIEVSTA